MKRFLSKQLALVLIFAILIPMIGNAEDVTLYDAQQETMVQIESDSDIVTSTDSSVEENHDTSITDSITSVDEETIEAEKDIVSDNEVFFPRM